MAMISTPFEGSTLRHRRRHIPSSSRPRSGSICRRGDILLVLCSALVFAVAADRSSAQARESTGLHVVGGAALGSYSGAMLGLVGSIMPCNRTLNGGWCVASSALTAGAAGLAMGGLVAEESVLALEERATDAALGLLVGGVLGLGLKRAVRQYGWLDVGAASLVGGALGAAPRGSLLGAGAGLLAGALGWWLIPDASVADVVMLTLAGAAVGGVADWAVGAASAADRGAQPLPLFTVRIR